MNHLVYALSTADPVATTELLEQIVARTNNDVIFFTIVIILGLAAVFIPLYRTITKSRKEDRLADADERKELIKVIERNTGAFTSLEATIKFNNDTVTRLLTRLTTQSTHVENVVTEIYDHQAKLIETLDKVNGTVTLVGDDMKDKQRQILEKAIAMKNDIAHLNPSHVDDEESLHELLEKLKAIATKEEKTEDQK